MNEINRPKHYTTHSEGMECIELTEMLMFNQGNAIKYLWRAGLKGPTRVDLEKAQWYVIRAKVQQPELVHGGLTPPNMPGDDIIAKAARGFTPLVGAAIALIANDAFDVALQIIDRLIAESDS